MRKGSTAVLWGPEERDTVLTVVGGLPTGEKPWQVTWKPYYESPSDRQRGYYRTTVLPILCNHVEESGFKRYTADEMHEWLKQKFGESALVEINGEAHEVIAFTTGNKGEIAAMTAYLDKVLRWAAGELGCYIPPPKERGKS